MKHFTVLLFLIFLCIITAFLCPYTAWGEPNNVPHVAVLQFLPSGTSPAHAALAGNYVEMELLQEKEIVLLERGQIKKIYVVPEANRYSCQDSSCAVLAGRELSADYVVLGDVVRKRQFSIQARVVSVSSGKIVFSCSAQYKRENEAKSAAAIIAKKIITGLWDLGHEPPPSKDDIDKVRDEPVKLDLYADLAVFQPFAKLGKLIDTGIGFTCGVMITDIVKIGPEPLRRIILGSDAGLLYACGTINSNDSGMIVPFSFSLGYHIPVIERIYFIPMVSCGLSYIRFHHSTGDGFDMEDNSATWAIDPHFRVMFVLGRPLVNNIRLEISTAFWILIESPHSPFFLTVHLGLNYRFGNR